MDPTIAYRDLRSALNSGDRAKANELANALREWLRRGGFMPVGVPEDKVRIAIQRGLKR